VNAKNIEGMKPAWDMEGMKMVGYTEPGEIRVVKLLLEIPPTPQEIQWQFNQTIDVHEMD
jgi:hypothetical protein